jgi:hypothetical protein
VLVAGPGLGISCIMVRSWVPKRAGVPRRAKSDDQSGPNSVFFHPDDNVTSTAGAGFTGRIFSGGGLIGEDQNVTSTNSYSATMSFSGSTDYVGFLVCFQSRIRQRRRPWWGQARW